MKKTDFFKNLLPFNGCVINDGENYITVSAPADGGVCTGRFSSLEDTVIVRIGARTVAENSDACFRLCSYDDKGNETVVFEENIKKDFDNNFDYTYSFDPISLGVYKNAVEFSAYLYSSGGADFHIKSFYITEGAEIQSDEVVESICNVVEGENGEKTVAVLRNSGETVYVPLVPKKVLFIGNSILLGMFNTYGMCSTDPMSDYAYHVQQAILEHNPDCTFKKLHGSAFEHSENDDSVESYMNNDNIYSGRPAKESFDPDTDLIIIQMTDNVNTDKKLTVFKKNADRFIETIRDMCPDARIIWVYGWYNKFNSHERLLELSASRRIELVDISSVRCKENESFSGQISLNAEGEEIVVKDTWITHPGNKGMKAIAEKIIEVLKF